MHQSESNELLHQVDALKRALKRIASEGSVLPKYKCTDNANGEELAARIAIAKNALENCN